MTNHPALQPRSAGELLDTAASLYRAHLRVFLRRVAAALVPIIIFRAAFQLNSGRSGDWLAIIPLHPDALNDLLSGLSIGLPLGDVLAISGSQLALFVLVLALLAEFLISATRQVYLGDLAAAQRSPSISYGTTAALVPAALLLLPLDAVVALIANALRLSALVVILWFQGSDSPAEMVRTLASLYSPRLIGSGVLLLLCLPWLLAAQAVVIEGCGIAASLRRSWQLTRGALWSVSQVTLLLVAITALLSALPLMLASVALAQASLAVGFVTIERVGQLLSQLVLALCIPFQIAAFTLLYYDLRVRKEAYDLEIRSHHAIDAEVAALNAAGIASWNSGDLAAAQAEFDRALALSPADYTAHSYRLAISLRREDFTGALAEANRTIELFPNDITTIGNRGYIHHKLGSQAQARQDYDQALRWRPDDQRLLTNSIALRVDEHDLEAALRELEHLLKLNPNHDWALYSLARVLARLGRADAALDRLAQACASNEQWIAQARHEADFESLRENPRMLSLLAGRSGAGAAL